MKKVITGAAVLLTGAILFLSTFVAAGNTGIVGGWNTGSGRFWTAVSEAKLVPVLVISVIVMITGAIVIICGNLKEKL